MDVTLKQLVDRISKIDLNKMQRCYERYSYLYDCDQQAQKLDREILALRGQVFQQSKNWIENVLSFQQSYKPNADILTYMKENTLYQELLRRVRVECERRAKDLDARFQKINALPRGSQLLSEGKAFIADWRSQPSPVEGYCKQATRRAIDDLEKKLGSEAVYFNAEELIASLEKSRIKGKNTADWCDKVEKIDKQYTLAQLKSCRNYSVYCALVEDAAFSRKVIRCQNYISALGNKWDFENVYELNAKLSAYQTDLRIVVPDFDKKWRTRLEEAKAAAVTQAEVWYKEGYAKRTTFEGFKLLEKAAKYDNVKAYAEVGYSYEFGRAVNRDPSVAVIWIEEALERGLRDGYFHFLLGFKYEHGQGATRNPQKAFDLYKKGESMPRGNYCYKPLAYCYLNGVGTNKNARLAYDYFLKYLSTENNQASAAAEYYWLGHLRETAWELGQDEQAALEWYEKAEKFGNADGRRSAERLREKFDRRAQVLSLIEAAQKKSEWMDFEKAYEWDEKLATYRAELKTLIPDFDTKWRMCMVFARTLATKKAEEWFKEGYASANEARKFQLMQKAAKYGNLKACGELGYYYNFAIGVAQNYNAAVTWIEKAIDGGLEDGYFHFLLGFKYEHGQGATKNAQKAFDLYKKGESMPRGNYCYKPLAYCYLNGVGTNKNARLAYDYFLKYLSTENNQANAAAEYYWLGHLKETAWEVGKDERAALEWYEKAEKFGNADGRRSAERLRRKYAQIEMDKRIDVCYALAVKGDVNAMDELGEYYYTGKGVTRSYTEAVEWFEKAAKRGNAHAIERLGDCYYYGHGVKQSYAKAEKLYNQAAKKS